MEENGDLGVFWETLAAIEMKREREVEVEILWL